MSKMSELVEQVERLEARMKEREDREESALRRIEANLSINTDRTNEMYEVFTAAAGGLKIIETLGRVAKPALWTLAAVAAFVTFFKTGRFEWPKL